MSQSMQRPYPFNSLLNPNIVVGIAEPFMGHSRRVSSRYPALLVSLIGILLVLILLSTDSHAETYVNTDIDANTTWTEKNGPYIVEDHINVLEGATLEISPGTKVLFDGQYWILVKGRLLANGTRGSEIVFRSNRVNPQNNDWSGLIFKSEGNRLSHCRILHASGAVSISYRNQTITDCTISDCINGFRVENIEATNISFQNVSFNIEIIGISIDGVHDDANIRIRNCTFRGSMYAGIDLQWVDTVLISNCTFVENSIGCKIVSSEAKVENCTFSSNTDTGLFIMDYTEVNVSYCTFRDNLNLGAWLQYRDSSYRCQFYNNSIALKLSSHNSVKECIFENNTVGIYLFSGNNTVCFNVFSNQSEHVRFERISSVNTWDNGSVGNYWSNYTRPDVDKDGIVDNPLQFNINNIDHYPVAEPFDLIGPSAMVDGDIEIDQHQTAMFDGTASHDDFGITEYRWTLTYNGSVITLLGETSSFVFHIAGKYQVRLTVTDTGGNSDYTLFTVTVIDIEPPTLVEDLTPQRVGTGNPFSFSIELHDHSEIAVVSVEYYYREDIVMEISMATSDGISYILNTAAPPSSIAPLFYRFHARDARDQSMRTPWSAIEIIDDDEPVITDLSPSEGTTGDEYSFFLRIDDNIGIHDAWIEYYFEGSDVVNTSIQSDDSVYYLEMGLPHKEVLWYVVGAMDTSGNVNRTPEAQITILDNDPPSIFDDRTPIEIIRGHALAFLVAVRDNIGLEEVRVVFRMPGDEESNVSLGQVDAINFTHSVMTESGMRGSVIYHFYAVDVAGNSVVSSPRSVSSTGEPPHIATIDICEIGEHELYYSEYEASDPDSDASTLTWSLETNASWLRLGEEPVRLEGNPVHGDIGEYYVNISVYDPDGGYSFHNFSLVVYRRDLPPTVNIDTPSDDDRIEGDRIRVSGTAEDDSGVVAVYIRWGDGEWTSCDGTAAWSFNISTGGLEEGVLTIEARSWDGGNHSDIDSVNVTIEKVEFDTSPVWLLTGAILVLVIVIGVIFYLRKDKSNNN